MTKEPLIIWREKKGSQGTVASYQFPVSEIRSAECGEPARQRSVKRGSTTARL